LDECIRHSLGDTWRGIYNICFEWNSPNLNVNIDRIIGSVGMKGVTGRADIV
jgi:hypothetical protein